MSREHNPIARLVSQIQQKWIDEVTPNKNIQLVRWLIKGEQKRLYKGFLKLESTPNGSLPCVPIVLLTPFEEMETHSKALIKDWIENFKKDKEIQQAISNKTIEFPWDVAFFEKKLNNTTNGDKLLLEMLQAFQKAIPNAELPLVVSLFPNAVQKQKKYQKWLHNLVKEGIPTNVKIMFFDNVNERYFDDLVADYQDISKTLSIPLDLDGAIEKLATMGNPNDPEIKFRKCIMEMGNSTSKNDLPRLNQWGNKGLEITKKMNSKSAYASAHLVYAGYLFNFKEFEAIDELLIQGMAIAKQGLLSGDKTSQPLIIQNYGLQASSKQLQKKKEQAVDLYCKQADKAIEYGVGVQALSAWWLAYNVIKKTDTKRYQNLIKRAYEYGYNLPVDTVKASCINFIAYDYFTRCKEEQNVQKCKEIDIFMTKVDTEHWKENVAEKRKAMEKRKYSLLNWF